MKASLFSYVISAALSFATIATASKPVDCPFYFLRSGFIYKNVTCRFACKQAP